jgi:3'-5' exoribonuclease
MTRKYLNELSDGDPVDEVYLLADKQLRANRNANLYLLASLRDKTGMVNGLMWNVTEESAAHINTGDFVRVKGKVQLFQGALQLIITNINSVPAEGLDADDFHPAANLNTERLLARLKEIMLALDEPTLCALMECFLVDESLVNDFSRAPAGVKAHHAYHGGLLEHVVNILETALRIADLYPSVNLDVLLVGIFLHDLGKIRELGYESSFTYTDEGQLLGHMLIGVELLNEKIVEVEKLNGEPFPDELRFRLKHMILSHHGSYAHGSSKLPMTPEAIMLHHLDNMDAKVHEFSRTIDDDPNTDSHWTPYLQRIERKLFKGGNGPTQTD